MLASLEARQGHRREALCLLRESLEHGLPSWQANDTATDPDLQSLRGDPRFNAILAYAKEHSAIVQKRN